MIVVTRCSDAITIEGHSGYAPIGQDIVCAGVSTLVQSLVYSIEELTKDTIEYDLKPGMATIKHGNLSEAGKLLFDSFFVGIETIYTNYPQHVRFCEVK